MFLIFISTMSLLVLLDVGIATRRPTDWWASAGQWVGGLGSIGAAGIAVWIAIEGWRKSERELGRVRQTEEQALAASMGIWIGKTAGPITLLNAGREGAVDSIGWYAVKVRNATDLPMYDVVVSVVFNHQHWVYNHRKPVVGPNATVDFELEHGAFENYLDKVVKDIRESRVGNSHQEIANAIADTNSDLDRLYVIERATVVAEFTDGNNNRWRRTSPGLLEKI